MRKLLVILNILFSATCFANTLSWGDLELNEQYELNQNVNIDNIITLHKGDKIEIVDSYGGEIPAIFLQGHIVNCLDPDLTSDLILFNPNPKDNHDRSIGLRLDEGCNLSMWIENNDFYTNSFFDQVN